MKNNFKKLITINVFVLFMISLVAGLSYALPDFQIKQVLVHSYDVYKNNQTVMFDIDIANAGDTEAYTNLKIDFGDGNVITKSFTFPMPAGFESTLYMNHQYKNFGDYTVNVEIDPIKQVDESNENNNLVTRKVSFIEPTYDYDVSFENQKYEYIIGTDVSDVPKDITINVLVKNTANQGLTVTLQDQDYITSSNGKNIVVFADKDVGVSLGQTGTLKYTLKGVDSSKEGVYTKTLNFVNQNGDVKSLDLVVKIIQPVVPDYSFTINFDKKIYEFNLSSTKQNLVLPYTINNSGNQILDLHGIITYRKFDGTPAWPFQNTNETQLSLFGINPGLDSNNFLSGWYINDTYAGDFNISVMLESQNGNSDKKEFELKLKKVIDQVPTYNFTVSMPTKVAYNIGFDVTTQKMDKIIEVTLNNTGNVAETINVSFGNMTFGNKVIATEYPSFVSLNAGESKKIDLKLKDIDLSLEGNYTRQIVFSNSNGKTVVLDLNVVIQKPIVTLEVSSSSDDFPLRERGSTFSGSFTVRNLGPMDLNGVVIETGFSGYTFSSKNITLLVNETRTIEFTKNVSITESSGSPIEPIYIKHPLLDHNYVYSVKYKVESKLQFGTIKYSIDDSSSKTLSSDIDAKPYSKLSFKVELKNEYPKTGSKDDRITMYNPEIRFVFDDSLDMDVDAVSFDDDIEAGDNADISFEFPKIPIDVISKSYNVKMIATAEDSEGVTHSVEKTFTITIKKDRHAVTFDNVVLMPEAIDIFELPRQVEVYIDNLCNIGSSDEDITLSFSSVKLGISSDKQLELKKDSDCLKESFTFDIDEVSEGAYPIVVKMSGKNIEDDVTKTVYLQILGNPDEEISDLVINQQQNLVPNTITENTVFGNLTSDETPVSESKTIFGLSNMETILSGILIAGIVFLVILIIVLGVKIAKDSKEDLY